VRTAAHRWRLASLCAAVSLTALVLVGCAPSSSTFWGGFWDGYNQSAGVSSSAPHTYGTVQSAITSDFSGLQYGNVYVLANGQIWEQVEAYYWYWYAYYPRVTIYSSYGAYKMQVSGIDRAVTVKRLR